MVVLYKRLHDLARIPEMKHVGDACFDLYAVDRKIDGKFAYYDLGFATAIPEGYEVEIHSRSGLAFDCDIKVFNGVGHIDSGYRGEWCVKLSYHGSDGSRPAWPEKRWDRIAQCKLVKLVKTTWKEVDNLEESERGNGGFGSTGK